MPALPRPAGHPAAARTLPLPRLPAPDDLPWLPPGLTADPADGPPASAGPGRTRARRLADLVGWLAAGARDLAFPPACPACRAPVADADGLCVACWQGLKRIERPYCERLGTPFRRDPGPGALSPDAIANPPPYDRARAVAHLDGTARTLVHALKYRDRTELAGPMARLLAIAGADLRDGAELLVPVPLHPLRLVARRFNQSALLADGIAAAWGGTTDPFALVRTRATRHQVGLDQSARAENVKGAFALGAEAAARLAGRHLVIVDDVLTSGATIAAVARTLKRARPARIDVLVFARVVGTIDASL